MNIDATNHLIYKKYMYNSQTISILVFAWSEKEGDEGTFMEYLLLDIFHDDHD